MSELFTCNIISSDRVFFEGEIQEIILPTLDGEYGLMAHHSDVTVAMMPGEIRIKLPDNSWITGIVSGGFADMVDNTAKLFAYTCERPEEIDVRRAQESKARAEEQMRQKQSLREYYHSQTSMARAMARLKGAKAEDVNVKKQG
ncbi:MAG: ATP synthase F1 subunit epsilon [Lachnospiraceae bacterium]|nr:ATP synthase F1 subunit epsilon [Lachnospiraceae bacterium]